MKLVLSIIITVVILAVQHYLSTRRQWQLGGILPVVYAAFAVWFKIYCAPEFKILPLLIVWLVLLSIWAEGRKKYEKKINKEINEMKSKDL